MVERVLGSMFGLILLFLILSRADEFNTVIRSIGGFVTDQTRVLQGVSIGGLYQTIPGTRTTGLG